MSTIEELVKRLTVELRAAEAIHITIEPIEAYRLCGLLQLAMRHDAVRDDGELRALVEKLVAAVGTLGPAVAETLAMGWQTEFDREH